MKTKFDLNQRLWPIQRPRARWNVNPPFDLQVIRSDKPGGVLYGFTADYGFSECDVFASEQEAQAECDQRNLEVVQ